MSSWASLAYGPRPSWVCHLIGLFALSLAEIDKLIYISKRGHQGNNGG